MVFTLLPLLSDVALAAVLVPVLVMVLTALILVVVCARHWKNRYALGTGRNKYPHSSEGSSAMTSYVLCIQEKEL